MPYPFKRLTTRYAAMCSNRTTFQSIQNYGIKKTRTTPLHLQSDRMIEGINLTLEELLPEIVSEQQKDWD